MQHTIREHTLRPRHAFTLSRESIRAKRTVFVELAHEGLVGLGEGAPIARYGETAQSCRAALERMRAAMPEDPVDLAALRPSLWRAAPRDYAARAAMDAAIMDWVGKAQGVPLYALWQIDPARMPPTSMTIAIDAPDRVRERAREAAGFRVLKLKVGVEQDRAMVDAIRDVTDVAIRADANEGYPDRETALREIEWLAGRGAELIEQPLTAVRLVEMVWLKERSPLLLIADEACLQPEDAPAFAEACHGVSVKLVKCGGIATAREAIEIARSCNLQVMIGCTIES